MYKKLKTDDLVGYENNSRTHSDEQIDQLVRSINEFGFTNPILIDEKNVIIAGHARLQASKKIGLEEVPCIVLSGLTDDQKKAYVIADNKLALNAGWDMDLLKLELESLKISDFDLELTGFSWDELEDILPDELPEIFCDEDDCPEVEDDPVSKSGDVWTLGNHRLMCGDSTSVDDVDRLMGGKKADMVFTDPPYNMDFSGGIHADGSKSFNSKHGKIKNDKMKKEDAGSFFDGVNSIIKMFCTGCFYITFYRLGILEYWQSLEKVGLKVRSLIIWNKGNHTLSNSDYMSMYEPIFYGWVKDHNFFGGKNGRDIWEISRTSKNDLHPTMKPIGLIEKAINDSTKTGHSVLDIFGGSGSTLIACEKTNRKCYMMELDPAYIDVIIKRWQQYTGKTAIHENGKSFDEIKLGQ